MTKGDIGKITYRIFFLFIILTTHLPLMIDKKSGVLIDQDKLKMLR